MRGTGSRGKGGYVFRERSSIIYPRGYLPLSLLPIVYILCIYLHLDIYLLSNIHTP